MKVIKGQYEATLIILKSRFIAEAFRVDTVEDVAFFLAQTKKNITMPIITAMRID